MLKLESFRQEQAVLEMYRIYDLEPVIYGGFLLFALENVSTIKKTKRSELARMQTTSGRPQPSKRWRQRVERTSRPKRVARARREPKRKTAKSQTKLRPSAQVEKMIKARRTFCPRWARQATRLRARSPMARTQRKSSSLVPHGPAATRKQRLLPPFQQTTPVLWMQKRRLHLRSGKSQHPKAAKKLKLKIRRRKRPSRRQRWMDRCKRTTLSALSPSRRCWRPNPRAFDGLVGPTQRSHKPMLHTAVEDVTSPEMKDVVQQASGD